MRRLLLPTLLSVVVLSLVIFQITQAPTIPRYKNSSVDSRKFYSEIVKKSMKPMNAKTEKEKVVIAKSNTEIKKTYTPYTKVEETKDIQEPAKVEVQKIKYVAPITPMTAMDNNKNKKETITITVYKIDPQGLHFVGKNTIVEKIDAQSIWNMLVDEQKGVKVLSWEVNNGIGYLNLSKEFVEPYNGESTQASVLYLFSS